MSITKIKLLPRSTLSAKVRTGFAGSIAAGPGVLVTQAAGIWTVSVDLSASAIVSGPTTSTDNAIPRFDGTDGTVLQDSGVLISDANLITGGTWNGAVVAGQYGGTGVANTGRTITLGGDIAVGQNFQTTPANAVTLTTTGATNVTLPTTGTLATLAGTETLSGKTLTAPTINGGTHTAITALGIRSTGAAFDLKIASVEAISADRTLTFSLGNANKTITLGGDVAIGLSFQITPANALTLTTTGSTNVTLPTTGTLATQAGSEALTGKTYNGLTITTTTGTLTIANGKTLTANNTLTFTGTDGSTLNVGTGGTLGTAAYVNTGTSGAVVGLLNGNNTYSGSMSFSGLVAYTSQLTSNAASHGNALVNFLDNSVAYGNMGAADNVVSGGSATDFGFYATNSLNFGAGASNTSRVKITLGMFTSGATGGDKGANTFNASALYLDGVRTGLTKVITFTRDLTAATGSVAYTGVGFKPTSLNASGGVGGIADYVLSSGFCDSALNQGNSGLVSGGGNVASAAFIRALDSTFGKGQSFVVTSMDSDGFTGTWTKTGLPTGTATYYVLCRC